MGTLIATSNPREFVIRDAPPSCASSQRCNEGASASQRISGYKSMSMSMSSMMEMGRPTNTIGSAFPGPFDEIDAGGMFTVVKIRKDITTYDDPGAYIHPPGTGAEPV